MAAEVPACAGQEETLGAVEKDGDTGTLMDLEDRPPRGNNDG